MSATKTDPAPAAPEAAEARSDTVSALERGISVLRCFSQEQPALGYAEIARMTGIPRPTVNRLVATLQANGMLKPALTPDRFTLGPAVVSLAQVFLGTLDVRAVARPRMQAMAEDVGASVYLAVRDGMEMVLIEACRPRSSILAPRLDVGSRAPMPNSALGRAYLAALDEPRRAQEPLPVATPTAPRTPATSTGSAPGSWPATPTSGSSRPGPPSPRPSASWSGTTGRWSSPRTRESVRG